MVVEATAESQEMMRRISVLSIKESLFWADAPDVN